MLKQGLVASPCQLKKQLPLSIMKAHINQRHPRQYYSCARTALSLPKWIANYSLIQLPAPKFYTGRGRSKRDRWMAKRDIALECATVRHQRTPTPATESQAGNYSMHHVPALIHVAGRFWKGWRNRCLLHLYMASYGLSATSPGPEPTNMGGKSATPSLLPTCSYEYSLLYRRSTTSFSSALISSYVGTETGIWWREMIQPKVVPRPLRFCG